MNEIVGVNNVGDPPVPIPNTVVKPNDAENTWLETARKNKEMPTKNTARWSSGQDGGLSRRNREFDPPTGHQAKLRERQSSQLNITAELTAHIWTISSVG